VEVALDGVDGDCAGAALLGVTVVLALEDPPDEFDEEAPEVGVFTGVALDATVLAAGAGLAADVDAAGFAVAADPDPDILDLGTALFTSTWTHINTSNVLYHASRLVTRTLNINLYSSRLLTYQFPINNVFSLCTNSVYADLTLEYNKTKPSRFMSFSVEHYFRREYSSIFLKIITKFSCAKQHVMVVRKRRRIMITIAHHLVCHSVNHPQIFCKTHNRHYFHWDYLKLNYSQC
jgi:hypothetical protein